MHFINNFHIKNYTFWIQLEIMKYLLQKLLPKTTPLEVLVKSSMILKHAVSMINFPICLFVKNISIMTLIHCISKMLMKI